MQFSIRLLYFFIPVGMPEGSRGSLRSSAPPENESPKKTLHPAVALGHGGMKSGDVSVPCPSVTLSLTDGYPLVSLPG